MKYKKYLIVRASLLRDLPELVNGKISEGWQPIGGVVPDKKDYWYQAMGLPE